MAHTQDPTPDRVIHYAPGSVLGPGDRPLCGNESPTAVYSEDPPQVAGCDDCDDQGGQRSSAGHVDQGAALARAGGIAVAKGGGRQAEAESRCALSRFKATVSRRPVIGTAPPPETPAPAATWPPWGRPGSCQTGPTYLLTLRAGRAGRAPPWSSLLAPPQGRGARERCPAGGLCLCPPRRFDDGTHRTPLRTTHPTG